MAYQTRGRDPLLDTNMAEAIEKRGKELLGLGLIALGLMAAMMIGSYTPDDPNFMVSTDAPVQNWLGRMGASLAAPLFMIVGWGAWSVESGWTQGWITAVLAMRQRNTSFWDLTAKSAIRQHLDALVARMLPNL